MTLFILEPSVFFYIAYVMPLSYFVTYVTIIYDITSHSTTWVQNKEDRNENQKRKFEEIEKRK